MYISLANVQARFYITLEVPIVSMYVFHPFVLIVINYVYENVLFTSLGMIHVHTAIVYFGTIITIIIL